MHFSLCIDLCALSAFSLGYADAQAQKMTGSLQVIVEKLKLNLFIG